MIATGDQLGQCLYWGVLPNNKDTFARVFHSSQSRNQVWMFRKLAVEFGYFLGILTIEMHEYRVAVV